MSGEERLSWPGWEVGKRLGQGSFGAVYEISRTIFDKEEKAALKVISIPQTRNDIEEMYNDGYDALSVTTRFRSYMENIVKEYQLMAEMRGHANIVHCDDVQFVQHDDGIGWDIYIKMELLTPLMQTLGSEIPEEQVIAIAKDMCKALVRCQSKNIIHRDIKPQNIFVSPEGDYKLGDFGVAKTAEHVTSGTKVGTYRYMAPEVYKGNPYGFSADLYSLGMVMHWMLNERRAPFLPLPPEVPTPEMEEAARNRRFTGEKIPAPIHGSDGLKKIVMKACEYNPAQRYKSAESMLKDLEALEKGVLPAVLNEEEVEEQDGNETIGAIVSHPQKNEEEKKIHLNEICDSKESDKPADEEAKPKEPVGTQTPEEKGKDEKDSLKKTIIGAILGALLIALAIVLYFNVHFWSEPTCTDSSVCALCGKVDDNALGHSWTEATCTTPKTCSVCGVAEGDVAAHLWAAATCTTPETCTACGATQGGLAAHSWAAATCTAPETCTACGATQGGLAEHPWAAATCTAPQTCPDCGATNGVPAGHQWIEATCIAPQTCAVRGETVGTFGEHGWLDATYTDPKCCKYCQQTQGTPLVHPLASYNVGDVFTFGRFEQDGRTGNGAEPIEWIVLDKQNGKILVISKRGLEWILEVTVKDGGDLVSKVAALPGVVSVNLMSHDGEVRF